MIGEDQAEIAVGAIRRHKMFDKPDIRKVGQTDRTDAEDTDVDRHLRQSRRLPWRGKARLSGALHQVEGELQQLLQGVAGQHCAYGLQIYVGEAARPLRFKRRAYLIEPPELIRAVAR